MKNYPCNPDKIPLIVRPWVEFDTMQDAENYGKSKWLFLKSVREGENMLGDNMYCAIRGIYGELKDRLGEQGVPEQIIDTIAWELVGSINRHVKWVLRDIDGQEIPLKGNGNGFELELRKVPPVNEVDE